MMNINKLIILTTNLDELANFLVSKVNPYLLEWHYSLSGISKPTQFNFFTFFDYKIEIALFFSLLLMLVLCSRKLSISLIVGLSKWTMICFGLLEFMMIKVGGVQPILAFQDSYKVNIYTQSTKIFVLVVAVLLLNLFFKQTEQTYLMILALHTLVLMGTVLISANNGFLLLITLENFSLQLYILTLTKKTYGGISAGVKYFVFGTLGSIIIFWGLVNIYLTTKSANFTQIDWLCNQHFKFNSFSSLQNSFAFSMLTLGFIIKFGVVPAHLWIADVYSGVPLYITAWFAVFVKVVLFAIFWQLGLSLINDVILDFTSIASVIIGTWMTLRQTQLKRIIAYGSLIHFSFIAMGSTQSAAVYLLTYVLASILLFFVLLELQIKNGKEIVFLEDLINLRAGGVYLSCVLLSSVVSLAGLPPFAGFFGKFEIWKDLFEGLYTENNVTHYLFLVLSFLLTLVIIFYYLRMIVYLFLKSDLSVRATLKSSSFALDSWHVYLFIILLFWLFVQGIIFY